MNPEKCIAGIFVGAGALLLIWKGHITEGSTLLGAMLGFFIGDWNGARRTSTQPTQ